MSLGDAFGSKSGGSYSWDEAVQVAAARGACNAWQRGGWLGRIGAGRSYAVARRRHGGEGTLPAQGRSAAKLDAACAAC